jgi:hypothetical protein
VHFQARNRLQWEKTEAMTIIRHNMQRTEDFALDNDISARVNRIVDPSERPKKRAENQNTDEQSHDADQLAISELQDAIEAEVN